MRALSLMAVTIALLVAACGSEPRTDPIPKADRAAPTRAGVTELRSVEQLRAAFNAHDGVPRLIVLASPT
jgi:hypothetical protein